MVSKFEVDVDSAVTNTSSLLFDVVEVIMVSFLMPGLPDSSDSVTEKNTKDHLLEIFLTRIQLLDSEYISIVILSSHLQGRNHLLQ